VDRLRFILVFIIGFAIYFWADANFFSLLQRSISSITRAKALGHIFAYLITLIPLLITIGVLNHSYKNIPEKLGLSKNLVVGIAFAFLCTLPMLAGYVLKFSMNKELSFNAIIINTISSAFFEEIIYRAFLFGQLYRLTRFGFIPSVFLGALLFGTAHLYQSTDFNELVGIFTITFLGSVLFSWIYAEWKFNLWTAVFLHCLMNLYWLIFNADVNALGGTYANVFRFSAVFLSILGTVLYKRKKRIPFEITRKTWWIKPKTAAKPLHLNA
jgi:membrane protease YdiL (CAAX protease family)